MARTESKNPTYSVGALTRKHMSYRVSMDECRPLRCRFKIVDYVIRIMIVLMMDAVQTSETFVNFHQTIRR
jgi:hypothetical protein